MFILIQLSFLSLEAELELLLCGEQPLQTSFVSTADTNDDRNLADLFLQPQTINHKLFTCSRYWWYKSPLNQYTNWLGIIHNFPGASAGPSSHVPGFFNWVSAVMTRGPRRGLCEKTETIKINVGRNIRAASLLLSVFTTEALKMRCALRVRESAGPQHPY